MRIAVACDHGGFPLKETVLEAVRAAGHEPLDLGAFNAERVDYPDYARKLGDAIQSGNAERGVLICGSGVGACVAANKVPGVRACLIHDVYSAHQGVEDDNMNVICLGGRVVGYELAWDLIQAFLSAQYEDRERFRRRLNKIAALEG